MVVIVNKIVEYKQLPNKIYCTCDVSWEIFIIFFIYL